MDGLLLKLLADHTGAPGRWFWKLFKPIRQDLNRLSWCFTGQPWMAAPHGFLEDESATIPFEGEGRTDIQLWQSGSLGRYADQFGEEYIQLWAIEPTVDDPPQLAALYSASGWDEKVIRQHARVWLLYTDSTCWEIYARKARLLEETREYLRGKPWVEVYASVSDRRDTAYSAAGLSDVWAAMAGKAPS